jgi:uncharacterized membrane protein HdeD (DUF308 family)
MQTKTRNLIRWLAIGGFAACGIYMLIEGILSVVQMRDDHWAWWLFFVPLVVIQSSVLLMVSYFIFARQYRRLCTLIAVVAAVVAFGCIIRVPEWIGVIKWLEDPGLGNVRWLVGSSISIAALVGAWLIARWVYRRGRVFLLRYVPTT